MSKHTITGSFRFLTEGNDCIVYTKESVLKAVKDFQKTAQKRMVLGELSHPDSKVIELMNASHKTEALRCDDNLDYEIDIDTLPTMKGQMVDKLIEADMVKAGARMTGDGNDLQIITFDIVEKP